MKSFIAAILLFFLTVGCIIFNSIYVCGALEELSQTATRVSSDSSASPQDLKELWERYRSPLSFSVKESKLERMSELVESLYFAGNSAETDKICILISQLCDEMRQYEKISIESLF